METTNLSKIRRNKMLNTINEIKKNITDEETLTNLSMIENELTKKKYGLIWEEHEEKIDKDLETKIPTFEEVNDKKIVSNPKTKFNFLLEGDNLHSLYLLEKTHKGLIDVIYIDPPYNTGKKNEWKYNDAWIDENDSYKHSKWLSFMHRRLELALSLLSKNGVIFISIDEHEISQLSLLCQEIFGEANLDYLIWQKTDSKVDRNTNAKIIKRYKNIHETVLVCYKNKNNTEFKKMMKLPEWKNKQTNPDNDSRGAWSSGIISYEEGHKNEDKSSPYYYSIITPSGKTYTRHWFILKEDFEKLKADNRISFPKNGDGVPRIKTFEKEEKEYYMESILRGVGTSSTAKDELIELFGNREIFDTPKPTKMIKELIRVASHKNSIILDFFAGSGTTAQAVLELNKEDNGNRNFILCTNNENNICENITYQRVKTVITGKRKDGSKYSEAIKTNLKYYKCSYIPRTNNENENLHNNLLINIKNLIQLENGIEIDDNKIKVYLDEDELDKFSKNQNKLDICEKIYISSDILLTSIQESIFKNNNIEVYIIPEYYFEDEIMEII